MTKWDTIKILARTVKKIKIKIKNSPEIRRSSKLAKQQST
jgi:hypothetical protein